MDGYETMRNMLWDPYVLRQIPFPWLCKAPTERLGPGRFYGTVRICDSMTLQETFEKAGRPGFSSACASPLQPVLSSSSYVSLFKATAGMKLRLYTALCLIRLTTIPTHCIHRRLSVTSDFGPGPRDMLTRYNNNIRT